MKSDVLKSILLVINSEIAKTPPKTQIDCEFQITNSGLVKFVIRNQ